MKKNIIGLWGILFSFAGTVCAGNLPDYNYPTPISQNEYHINIFRKKGKKNEKSKQNDNISHQDTAKSKNEYNKIVGEGTVTQEGMFKIHQKKNDYYFEIPAHLLNRDMLIVNKLTKVSAAINHFGLNKGINYQTELVRFEWDKANNRIQVREIQPTPLYPEKDAIGASVEE
ncbi:MAG: DUF5118 domain-containing protein, partial [Coprobacter sp.]|nr:DUF5118 domain-containing protein [Coprobacter sp.]